MRNAEVMDESYRLLWRREALSRGYQDGELRRARRTGALQPVRRGAYASPAMLEGLDAEARNRLVIEATASAASSGAVISHTSAALMHGIALWNCPLAKVHLTVDKRSGGRTTPNRHVHPSPLDDSEVVLVNNVPVTSVARTVIDCARTLPFEQAVVIGDSALQQRLVSAENLDAALAACRGRHGGPAAARALAFLDARSESVGESRSRVLIHRTDLPKPDLQRVIHDSTGTFIGRVNFLFEPSGAIGEFDGMCKYTGPTAESEVRREKLREDALRATGAAVARWTWRDLNHPTRVATRIRQAIALTQR